VANELILSNGDDGLRIAILENKRLVELHHEKRNNLFQVGDVFLGRVSRVLASLNAVFVDIGHSRDGFLHYFDLGPQVKSQLKHLNTALQQKKIVPLNEFKGYPDISTKGPRLSSQLSIAGQYIILMPFSSEVSVSRKFKSNDEKKRIRQLLEGICPENVGIIVRTAAEGVEFEKLKAEFDGLYAKWEKLTQEVLGATPPRKVLSEIDRTTSLLRDMLSIGFDAIYTDDQEVYNEIYDYLEANQPEQRRILNLKKTRQDLFEHFGIEKQIKAAFGKNVNMSNGSYLVIEHTEALHVIDVNSGSQRTQNSPEENALAINLEACSEIARQLRLRDMGGIIVIDFIDQKNLENRRRVYSALKMEMARDRARHTILPMSRFGLIQITRQRVRPEMAITTEEVCPTCNGTGKIGPSILIADQIENNVDYLIRKSKIRYLKIAAHPFVTAYYREGFPSRRLKWFLKYRKWIELVPQSSLGFTAVKYLDENEEEIKLD